jgi:hypothetical protein
MLGTFVTRTAALGALVLATSAGCGGSSAATSGSASDTKTNGGSARSHARTHPHRTSPQHARNLPLSPQVRHHFSSVLAAVSSTDYHHVRVGEALPGSVYYASLGDNRYALAKFKLPRTGTRDQPSLFVRFGDEPWVYAGDRLGAIARASLVPCAVRAIWGFTCRAPPNASRRPLAGAAYAGAADAVCGSLLAALRRNAKTPHAHDADAVLGILRSALAQLVALPVAPAERQFAAQLQTDEARLFGLMSWQAETERTKQLITSFDVRARVNSHMRELHRLMSGHGLRPCF